MRKIKKEAEEIQIDEPKDAMKSLAQFEEEDSEEKKEVSEDEHDANLATIKSSDNGEKMQSVKQEEEDSEEEKKEVSEEEDEEKKEVSEDLHSDNLASVKSVANGEAMHKLGEDDLPSDEDDFELEIDIEEEEDSEEEKKEVSEEEDEEKDISEEEDEEKKEVSESEDSEEEKKEVSEEEDEEKKEVSEEEGEDKEDVKVDVKEDVRALLSDKKLQLSEEFKQKTKIIFESAVRTHVRRERKRMKKLYESAAKKQLKKIRGNLRENVLNTVDSYLNYVCEEWFKKNKLAIESGIRTQLAEQFIGKLHRVFKESFIEVPKGKVNLLDDQVKKAQRLSEELNDEMNKNVELTKELSKAKRENCLLKLCEGLSVAQAEKLRTVAEGLTFKNEEQFKGELKTLKESYFPKKVGTPAQDLTTTTLEQGGIDGTDEPVGLIAEASALLSRKP